LRILTAANVFDFGQHLNVYGVNFSLIVEAKLLALHFAQPTLSEHWKVYKTRNGAEPNVRPPGTASSTAETILGGSNAARSNAIWRMKVESCLKSRRNSTWVGQHERL